MTPLLPLEKYLKNKSSDKSSFPNLAYDYFEFYQSLVSNLRSNVYKDIGVGLAANSALTGFYTSHDSDHFDQVVNYAGFLLGINNENYSTSALTISPYEVYILLVAIRIHDAGNIFGREKHEKKCYQILKDFLPKGADLAEAKVIANIAQAHGGKVNGNKDTIGLLPKQNSLASATLRDQLLAAVLRFADEICENRGRSANYALECESLPEHSIVYHKYASVIVSNRIQDHLLYIDYHIHSDDVIKTWLHNNEQEYLIDIIYNRLEKMNLERIYCNRFTRCLYTIDGIRAEITIIDRNRDPIHTITAELSDEGYPNQHFSLVDQLKDSSGAKVCELIRGKQNA